MKAIILAAGYATRLYPLTKDTPKPLLKVKGQPIIEHILESLSAVDEINEVYVVTNNRFYNSFIQWSQSYLGRLKITIVNDQTNSNEDRLGSLGDIKYVIETQSIDEDMIIVAGDNLFEFSLKELMKTYALKKGPIIALYDVMDMELAKQYGIVAIDGSDKIIHFEEKPKVPRSTLSSTGIYVYPMTTIKKLIKFIELQGKKDKAGDFIEWLHKEEDVYCHLTQEKWFDIGTLDQLGKAEKEFKSTQKTEYPKKKLTVLVTGGAGFIGSHLCDRLVLQHKVICVDNLFTGSKKNIQHLMTHPNFTFIQHDIIDPFFLDNLKIDQIYNLACPASPLHYQYNAIRTIKANVVGTMNMLGLAKRHKSRILQASTSEIYGDPQEHPQKEAYWGNVNCIGPRACYDEGKRCAETLLFDYHRQNSVDIRIVRIFNTYGPRMAKEDGRVVSNFILQALKSEEITVYGDGNQTRSFCFVKDMVSGIIAMMEQDNIIGPVNLGNPSEFTILELAKKVVSITGSSANILHKPLPVDDPRQRKPDISLAKKSLSWTPTIELDQGLKYTIEYFRSII